MAFWEHFLGFDPNRQNLFPGQQPGEEVEHMTVFHWMCLMPFLLQLIGASLLLVGLNVFRDFFGGIPPSDLFYINTVGITLIIHLLCLRLYNYFLKVMLVTNYRLIDIRHSVFLKRQREVISMVNIQDFRYEQKGILPRIFRYGTLVVLGTSTDVKYIFRYVPHVDKMHHLLGEIHQQALRNPEFAEAGKNARALRPLVPSG